MKNQLKEFFNLEGYEEHFSGDGPNFSFATLAIGAAVTFVVLFFLFSEISKLG